MPSSPRWSEFFAGVRGQLPLLLGVTPFGLAYGAYAVETGLSPALAQSMSWIVFGGASQFVGTELIAQGVPGVVIVFTAALVNLRHMLYSASIAPYVEHLHRRWRALLAYLLTDEAYAVATARYRRGDDAPYAHWYFLGTALALWVCWQVSTAIGVFVGTAVPQSWQLDFALPLTFLAIVVPAVNDRPALAAAAVAGIVALAGFEWPYGTGLLLAAAAGITAGLIIERGGQTSQRRRSGGGMNLWLIVIAMGAATYAIRLSMLVFVHHSTLPGFAREALRYVTPAVLTAIILPAVLYVGEPETFDAGLGNERLLAAILAAVVARVTANVWLTIGAGMCVLWALEAMT